MRLVEGGKDFDREAITRLVNNAYELETGDTGVAFKNTPRLLDNEDSGMGQAYAEDRVVLALGDGPDPELLGMIMWIVEDGVMYFGPLAVSVKAQGKRIGKKLIARVARLGQERGARFIDISVVNWRTDILPMYQRWGFVETGHGDFPDPERCTRPCFFINLRGSIDELVNLA